jgi:glycine hydroxymethyltransferase
MIFAKKDDRGFEDKINFSVFPMLQGGPHEHQIGALAAQLKQVATPEFKDYIQKTKANAKRLGEKLVEKGLALATGGTENHLCLIDLRPIGVTGSKMETICDAVNITLNKNCVPGDRSALSPGGVRVGAPAMTTRGFTEEDFDWVAEMLNRAALLAKKIQEDIGSKKLVDFKAALIGHADVAALKLEVNTKCGPFFMPGV